MKTWKRILALTLSLLMILSCFTACGGGGEEQKETEPAVTESPEEAKVLKVLTLGHSLAVNSTRMLNLVAHAEGYEEMVIGTLYYSGCPLSKHVQFMNSNSAEYKLFLSSTTTANEAPKEVKNVTMLQAIEYDYWDIIVMQGGTFELAESETFTSGAIQLIQKYVNEHKKNPNAVFMWHLPWAFSTDIDLQRSKSDDDNNNSFMQAYKAFDNDRRKLFAAFAKNVNDYILPDETFVKLIPSGAAVENAISSYMTEKDILCDYAHATDLGRLIAAYTWYCVLTGVDKLEEIKLDAIPRAFVATSVVTGDRVLTEDDKALILESVNNALANPLQITESQYKEAPEGYVPVMNQDG